MKKALFLLFLSVFLTKTYAQDYFPVNETVHNTNKNYTVFTNATIYVTPTQKIEKGTLLVQDGKVVAVGNNIAIPKNSISIDLAGKTIYPSFIDIYTSFGVEKPKSNNRYDQDPLYDTKRVGYYWNESIRPEVNTYETFKYDQPKAEELLKAGFGVVGTHIPDGVAQGTGILVALNNAENNKRIIANKITNHLAFSRSALTNQAYPSSLMGMMALLRQMYLDLDWYKKGNSETKDLSLEAMANNEKLVQIFTAEDKLNSLRAAKIAKEFGLTYILKGSGNEFERIDEIKNTNAKYIIPISFPEAYDVSNPYLSNQIELADMRFWNQAPTNLKVLSDNGVIFALTTDKLKKTEDFKPNLLKAIKYGFDKTKALEALTTIPAAILGKSNEVGSLKTGSFANFVITSGEIFDEKTILYENWVQGTKYVVNDINAKDIRGNYDLTVGKDSYKWKIDGTAEAAKSEITTADAKKVNSTFSISKNWVSLLIKPSDTIKGNFTRLTGFVEKPEKLSGKAILPNGDELVWTALKTSAFVAVKDSSKVEKPNPIVPTTFPNIAFGDSKKLTAQTLLFKNATVWTNEKDGILTETDVLIKNGKIAAVGKNLSDASATVIDAKGKHITSGIIDEHSHIAISRGVNESGHNSTAEVTIEDVVNSEDIDIYRDLAGGVTTSQLLHGSANPIGGRSAIVKWKWGAAPDEMLYKNQPKFIKFALGENVKQANWGIDNPTRFPQTRMGVEQVFTDYFQRAKEYDESWKKFNAGSKKGKAPRVDLEMQTLAEIINKQRFITCHSYVESEILMLMNVAEKFNFRVNTFTHILEGYKVADKMKEHGVGASTFSDWWAYKFEVNDAIPFNGPIMHNAGLVVAYNSDDSEMSRRLNQEAAKAVKYGNISEEDAWKFVTLNPAKLLHIDDKVGSLKVGKDADVVLWSDNPLSIYAVVEKTIVDGVVYFDIQKDAEKQLAITKERSLLIGQMLLEKNKGMVTQAPTKKEKVEYHCDTLEQ
ncbi:imidazolonepropionase-like amidohydrolase [Flavobacterium sp. 90]|uniref:amidohydrolase family protein n=1 Tax=unclassified Flavobacterium TaxID=196869 RepID=UPI000EABE925|nr:MULTISPECIES: amidohydrolase family protein [unclassified Flavobacterium]RKR08817.1 imidazolonepropionase-like amidohydrolase [Flavobacterium sp. 81]TCK52604.1 imidazolonepropionase-like amidohydrolase [Flavobacterium sp. 90]